MSITLSYQKSSSDDAAVEDQLEDEQANSTRLEGIENPTPPAACNLSKGGQGNQRGQKVGSVVDEDSPGTVTVSIYELKFSWARLILSLFVQIANFEIWT